MIVGLDTRTRYVRIGKFKIGEKNERGLPKALDYFRITDGGELVWQRYGEKPSEVLVYLPDNLSAATWDPYYKRYGKSGLACKGDGIVGQEVQIDGKLKARDCAERGCPFAQPVQRGGKTEAPACRPIGILNFKVVGVLSAGVYQLDIKGRSAVERADGYLRQLQEVASGDLSGVPFKLAVSVGKGKDGFPSSRIELRDAPETSAALADPYQRQQKGASSQRVRGFVITSDSGEVIASPEIPEGEHLELRAKFALLLNSAIERHFIVGEQVERYYQTLRTLSSLSEGEAGESYAKLEAFVQDLKATQDQSVEQHGEADQRYAGFAFKYLKTADYQALGFEQPADPAAFTRIQARKGVNHLYQQRKLKAA